MKATQPAADSESTIVLTLAGSLQLLELLENPPPKNQKFLEAQAWYRQVKANAESNAGQQQPLDDLPHL